jgi:Ion channel
MATREYRWRHLLLLLSILLLFIVSTFVVSLRHGIVILNVVGVSVLLAGIYALIEHKRLFIIAIVLSVASIIGTWLLLSFPSYWSVVASHTCIVALVTFFSVTILVYVLDAGRVTSDKIFAAICVYLLLGFAWSYAYALLDEVQPGSFTALTEINRNDYSGRIMQLRYFSFVTLTTVGYGDIVPRLPVAQTMATLEAVVGQVYLAVLIARLVGLHIVHASGSNRPP